jgi:hypothetical protein
MEALGLLLFLLWMIGCSVPSKDQITEPPSVMYTPLSSAPLSPDPARGQVEEYGDPAKAEEGRKLHKQMLARHPEVGEFYKKPFIWGAGTNTPMCCIFVPVDIWNSLPEDSRELLAHYAAGSVEEVEFDPFKYMSVLESSPAAPLLRANVQKMTGDSWGIVAGHVTNGGSDISAGHIVKTGIAALASP